MKKKNEILPGTKEMTIYKRTKKEIFLDFYFILHCVWLQLRKEKTKYQGEGYDIEKKKKQIFQAYMLVNTK